MRRDTRARAVICATDAPDHPDSSTVTTAAPSNRRAASQRPAPAERHDRCANAPSTRYDAHQPARARRELERDHAYRRPSRTLPAKGAANWRCSVLRPAPLSGQERERERESESAVPTHLPTGPNGHAATPDTNVPNELTRKQPLFMRSSPLPYKNSPAKALETDPEEPTQTRSIVPDTPAWDAMTTGNITSPQTLVKSELQNTVKACPRHAAHRLRKGKDGRGRTPPPGHHRKTLPQRQPLR